MPSDYPVAVFVGAAYTSLCINIGLSVHSVKFLVTKRGQIVMHTCPLATYSLQPGLQRQGIFLYPAQAQRSQQSGSVLLSVPTRASGLCGLHMLQVHIYY